MDFNINSKCPACQKYQKNGISTLSALNTESIFTHVHISSEVLVTFSRVTLDLICRPTHSEGAGAEEDPGVHALAARGGQTGGV